MTSRDEPEQPALLGLDDVGAPRRRRPAGPVPVAEVDPVARVVLDLQPAHLDREYDYLVPAPMAHAAVPGVRVRARFGPQEVGGFVVARLAESDHDGRLQPLRRVVSPDPVLTAPVLELARRVAERCAGTVADVLRLAVPPRHARVEGEVLAGLAAGADLPTAGTEDATGDGDDGAALVGPPVPPQPAGDGFAAVWAPYRGGEAFCRRVLAGEAPRAVWTPLPGLHAAPGSDVARVPHWAAAVAQAVRATVVGGRRALVVVPDARDVALLADAVEAAGVADVVRLQADDGPAPRYRAFLRARHGLASVVVGTRAAVWAPVPALGLVVLWGDGEEILAEPHAPYPHARDVLALRSELEGAALLVASPGRTVQAQALVARGWAHEIAAPRDVLRARSPRVRALTSVELAREGAGAGARLPSAAWRAAKDALAHGPVLVQVPRAGYVPTVACGRCRTAARCTACHGPLGMARHGSAPQCTWCGRLAAGWQCPECGDTRLRAVRVGSERTAEELGRAFSGVPVKVSASTAPGGVLDHVPARPAIVVATPGAEPVADDGYVAALLLDAAVSTAGTALTTATDAAHRWLAAAALVRPDGQVLLVGDAAPAPTAALVRADPAGLADRELAERRELDLPPAVRVAAVTGDPDAVRAVVGRLDLPPDAVLGPVPVPDDAARLDEQVRVVARVPLTDGLDLARRLRASLAVRSARREGGRVRVQLDPPEML
ncbi:replication restart DNA helicase PriA [Isoptericola jiangsuensis]|uniref:Probable replication restart protein PriA n=1 Tax=Isoptericola jiangsuensis TaxID=548579 RepID=A0A2A9EXF1_9MICO|nr:primosomal protein N' [Isoptericola jiangsuensis]PFG43246.1 replication restart DNA helicase PriA [Isoptericola jiangsuensis]